MFFQTLDLTILQIIILSILVSLIFIQLIIYLCIYFKPLSFIKSEPQRHRHYTTKPPGVSVIIYACNDTEQLAKNLPIIMDQDYEHFEVIVVNDGSSDQTEDFLKEMENKYDNLYHTFLAEGARNLSRKKLSLTLGIKAAKNDVLLFTNANCHPISKSWIANIARNFTAKTDIVIGNTMFNTDRKERFIAFDLLFRAIRIFGFSLASKPYTADGTNMAYRKTLFFKNKGYAKYMNLHPGEDDLFVYQTANKTNAKIELSADSFMIADYDNRSLGWKQLKRNNRFTSRFFHNGAKWLFGFDSLTRNIIPFVAVAGALLFCQNLILAIISVAVLIIYWILLSLFWYIAGKKMMTRKFFFLVPLFGYVLPFANFIFKIENIVRGKRNYTWNSVQS